MQDIIRSQLKESSQVKRAMVDACSQELEQAANAMIETIRNGGKIMWCGNGGSAADAQHLSTELLGGLRNHDRPAIASLALTTDTSFLTAWTNDSEFTSVFSRQIEGLGRPGDCLVAISTSGNSKNVVDAIRQAKEKNITIIIFTGKNGGVMGSMGDIKIQVPSDDTQRIQEGHILSGHIICELVEAEFTP